jgi:glycosyltransferase involved in cell wall biosynthesis
MIIQDDLARAVEAVLFASEQPLTVDEIRAHVGSEADVPAALRSLEDIYAGRGIEIVIGLGEDPERAVARIRARTETPLVVDVTVEGAAILDIAPARMPDLYAGAPVLASDLEAFVAVLGDGQAGVTFPVGDSEALAAAVIDLVRDPDERHRLRDLGLLRARSFDWSVVAQRVMAVYETVIEGADKSPEESLLRGGLLSRLRWPTRGEAR